MLLQRYHFLKLPLCGINHKTTTALASRQLFTVFPNNFTTCPDTICIVIEPSIETRLQKKTGGTTVSRILYIYTMDEVEGYETNGLSRSSLQRSLVAIIYTADI